MSSLEVNVRRLTSTTLLKYDKLRKKENATWDEINWDEVELVSGSMDADNPNVIQILNTNPAYKELFEEQRLEVNLRNLVGKGNFQGYCDIQFVVEDGCIPVHSVFFGRLWDAFLGGVVKEMLELPQRDEMITIILDRVKLTHLRIVLSLLYKGQTSYVPEEEDKVKELMQMLGLDGLETITVLRKKKPKLIAALRLNEEQESVNPSVNVEVIDNQHNIEENVRERRELSPGPPSSISMYLPENPQQNEMPPPPPPQPCSTRQLSMEPPVIERISPGTVLTKKPNERIHRWLDDAEWQSSQGSELDFEVASAPQPSSEEHSCVNVEDEELPPTVSETGSPLKKGKEQELPLPSPSDVSFALYLDHELEDEHNLADEPQVQDLRDAAAEVVIEAIESDEGNNCDKSPNDHEIRIVRGELPKTPPGRNSRKRKKANNNRCKLSAASKERKQSLRPKARSKSASRKAEVIEIDLTATERMSRRTRRNRQRQKNMEETQTRAETLASSDPHPPSEANSNINPNEDESPPSASGTCVQTMQEEAITSSPDVSFFSAVEEPMDLQSSNEAEQVDVETVDSENIDSRLRVEDEEDDEVVIVDHLERRRLRGRVYYIRPADAAIFLQKKALIDLKEEPTEDSPGRKSGRPRKASAENGPDEGMEVEKPEARTSVEENFHKVKGNDSRVPKKRGRKLKKKLKNTQEEVNDDIENLAESTPTQLEVAGNSEENRPSTGISGAVETKIAESRDKIEGSIGRFSFDESLETGAHSMSKSKGEKNQKNKALPNGKKKLSTNKIVVEATSVEVQTDQVEFFRASCLSGANEVAEDLPDPAVFRSGEGSLEGGERVSEVSLTIRGSPMNIEAAPPASPEVNVEAEKVIESQTGGGTETENLDMDGGLHKDEERKENSWSSIVKLENNEGNSASRNQGKYGIDQETYPPLGADEWPSLESSGPSENGNERNIEEVMPTPKVAISRKMMVNLDMLSQRDLSQIMHMTKQGRNLTLSRPKDSGTYVFQRELIEANQILPIEEDDGLEDVRSGRSSVMSTSRSSFHPQSSSTPRSSLSQAILELGVEGSEGSEGNESNNSCGSVVPSKKRKLQEETIPEEEDGIIEEEMTPGVNSKDSMEASSSVQSSSEAKRIRFEEDKDEANESVILESRVEAPSEDVDVGLQIREGEMSNYVEVKREPEVIDKSQDLNSSCLDAISMDIQDEEQATGSESATASAGATDGLSSEAEMHSATVPRTPSAPSSFAMEEIPKSSSHISTTPLPIAHDNEQFNRPQVATERTFSDTLTSSSLALLQLYNTETETSGGENQTQELSTIQSGHGSPSKVKTPIKAISTGPEPEPAHTPRTIERLETEFLSGYVLNPPSIRNLNTPPYPPHRASAASESLNNANSTLFRQTPLASPPPDQVQVASVNNSAPLYAHGSGEVSNFRFTIQTSNPLVEQALRNRMARREENTHAPSSNVVAPSTHNQNNSNLPCASNHTYQRGPDRSRSQNSTFTAPRPPMPASPQRFHHGTFHGPQVPVVRKQNVGSQYLPYQQGNQMGQVNQGQYISQILRQQQQILERCSIYYQQNSHISQPRPQFHPASLPPMPPLHRAPNPSFVCQDCGFRFREQVNYLLHITSNLCGEAGPSSI